MVELVVSPVLGFALSRAEPVVRRLETGVRRSALLTDVLLWLAILPYSLTMFPVPLPPSLTPMPRSSVRTRSLDIGAVSFSCLVGAAVSREVFRTRQAFEVVDGIVASIAVDVVDVMALGDRAVMLLPNLPVKHLNAAFAIGPTRLVVAAVAESRRVGVSFELDSVELDDLNSSFHVSPMLSDMLLSSSSISPYRRVSRRTKPLPSTQTG